MNKYLIAIAILVMVVGIVGCGEKEEVKFQKVFINDNELVEMAEGPKAPLFDDDTLSVATGETSHITVDENGNILDSGGPYAEELIKEHEAEIRSKIIWNAEWRWFGWDQYLAINGKPIEMGFREDGVMVWRYVETVSSGEISITDTITPGAITEPEITNPPHQSEGERR